MYSNPHFAPDEQYVAQLRTVSDATIEARLAALQTMRSRVLHAAHLPLFSRCEQLISSCLQVLIERAATTEVGATIDGVAVPLPTNVAEAAQQGFVVTLEAVHTANIPVPAEVAVQGYQALERTH